MIDPGGTVMVVLFAGGGGWLLLNERHPPNANGSKRTTLARRMQIFLHQINGMAPKHIDVERRNHVAASGAPHMEAASPTARTQLAGALL
jgi:hypothetical protein